MKHEDEFGDEWDESEEMCFNCEHMRYFTDGYCDMEICNKEKGLKFTTPTNYCDDFKNRWKK